MKRPLPRCSSPAARNRRATIPPCKEALRLGEKVSRDVARRFFETNYVPHRVEGVPPGLVTGYYEPEVSGSRERSGKFQVPVYRPAGRSRSDDAGSPARALQRPAKRDAAGRRPARAVLHARGDRGGRASRAGDSSCSISTIPSNCSSCRCKAPAACGSPTDHGCGSAMRRRTAIPIPRSASFLLERGERPPQALTMEGLKSWLRADPARGRALMQENKSYVFFRELPEGEAGAGPVGAQGVPLTPGRSLAVDAAFHALGTPIFVTAPDLAVGRRAVSPADDRPGRRFGDQGAPARRYLLRHGRGCRRDCRHDQGGGGVLYLASQPLSRLALCLAPWASATPNSRPTPSFGRAWPAAPSPSPKAGSLPRSSRRSRAPRRRRKNLHRRPPSPRPSRR